MRGGESDLAEGTKDSSRFSGRPRRECAQDLQVTGITEMAGRSGSVGRDAKRLGGL